MGFGGPSGISEFLLVNHININSCHRWREYVGRGMRNAGEYKEKSGKGDKEYKERGLNNCNSIVRGKAVLERPLQ